MIKTYTEDQISTIIGQMVEMADYLVKSKIVHCNLTPHNVIVVSEKPSRVEVKVCGFGSAK